MDAEAVKQRKYRNPLEKAIPLASTAVLTREKRPKETGLAFWMNRVLEECDNASLAFAPDPVHDLRVALRRCRSIADGLRALDPDKRWKEMKKAGRRLFRSLGELRDVQVMMEWVGKLGDADDPVAHAFQHYLLQREAQLKTEAGSSLQVFDRKQWAKWGKTLPARSRRFRDGSPLFQHLALERWTTAYDLHRLAIRSRSQVALHNLRIGIKRFRYIVENFLPQQHSSWKADLKDFQDLLGEVHDLDVLWATGIQIKAFIDAEAKSRWHQKILNERSTRVQRYRVKMTGQGSLWAQWRKQLPQGHDIRRIATQRLRLWASMLDPDFAHSRHVAFLATAIFDGIVGTCPRWMKGEPASLRLILQMAALLHDVGRSRHEKNHHKSSYRLISSLAPPLGWNARELRLAAVVARYHRGSLPRAGQKSLAAITTAERSTALRLAGILRLAAALDSEHDGHITRLDIESTGSSVIIHAEGYSPRTNAAERVAAARHLLEVTCKVPVFVKQASSRRRQTNSGKKRGARN